MSIAVSTYVWHNSKQKGSALTLLLAMADMANDSGVCWPSVRYLANKMRMTVRNVQKILRRLESDGDLSIRLGGGAKTPYGATNRYTIALKHANEGSPQSRTDVHPTGEQGDTRGVNAETSESSLETSIESSSETNVYTPPPPAYARAKAAGGVQPRFEPVSIDSILDHPIRAEARPVSDDVDPARAIQGKSVVSNVNATPSPTNDDTEPADEDASTEEETVSSGDTKPVDVPEWANIFTRVDREITRWLEDDFERLKAWCEYAPEHHLGGGFVRDSMRVAGCWPPEVKSRFYEPKGSDYVTGEFADFVQH